MVDISANQFYTLKKSLGLIIICNIIIVIIYYKLSTWDYYT